MARKGGISKERYFPTKGDMLENHDEGLCWEVKRTHRFVDEKGGKSLKYALLVAYHPEIGEGNEPIAMTVLSGSSTEYLEEINIIHKMKPGGHVKYEWNPLTKTWQS
jgi:hypothetical protein